MLFPFSRSLDHPNSTLTQCEKAACSQASGENGLGKKTKCKQGYLCTGWLGFKSWCQCLSWIWLHLPDCWWVVQHGLCLGRVFRGKEMICFCFHRDTIQTTWLSHSEALLHPVLNMQRLSQAKNVAPPSSPNTAAAVPAGCSALGMQPCCVSGEEISGPFSWLLPLC